MIIRGSTVGNVAYWSKHLLRDDTNTRAEVKEIDGLLAGDLPTALREMEAIALQSRCRGNFMYQANINPQIGERLTAEQWQEAVDTLEKKLGLEGHQRIVVEHEKEGRIHRHVMWNRVDTETLEVADMWRSHQKEMAVQRELEQQFGLEPTPEKNAERKRAPELWEIRAAERSKIDRDQVRADINEMWQSTDSGKAFAAAVAESPYTLAKGDRRDFCIVDAAGDAHSLTRCVEGARAGDIRARMADVDRESLPTVSEARTEQRAADHSADEAWKKLKAAARADNEAQRETENEAFWDRVKDRREEKAEATQKEWREKVETERKGDSAGVSGGPSGKPALEVLNGVTGMVETLADFVLGLFAGGEKRPPHKYLSEMDQIRAERRARASWEHLAESVARGERLSAADISNLPLNQLENIKAHGDDYVRDMIEMVERDRKRDRERGWER